MDTNGEELRYSSTAVQLWLYGSTVLFSCVVSLQSSYITFGLNFLFSSVTRLLSDPMRGRHTVCAHTSQAIEIWAQLAHIEDIEDTRRRHQKPKN